MRKKMALLLNKIKMSAGFWICVNMFTLSRRRYKCTLIGLYTAACSGSIPGIFIPLENSLVEIWFFLGQKIYIHAKVIRAYKHSRHRPKFGGLLLFPNNQFENITKSRVHFHS